MNKNVMCAKFGFWVSAIALILICGGAFTASASDSPPAASETQVPGSSDDVDQVITNANLRAYSGSKSKWSISNIINYDGGTITSPFAEDRPNIAQASATSPDTDINDQINIKRNIDAFHSLLFGVGVRKMAPFTGSGPGSDYYNQGGKDVDIYDPTLTYQFIFKCFGSIQSVAQVSLTQYTRQDIHSTTGDGNNLDRNVSYDQENMYELGDFSIGGSIGIGANTPTDSNVDYSRYQIWIDPYLEYKINENLNIRLVADAWSYEYYSVKQMVHDTYTQTVGVGWSITRDILLYPNIQFLPEHISSAYTNVGLTATINLF